MLRTRAPIDAFKYTVDYCMYILYSKDMEMTMQSYLTPEEAAQHLKVAPDEIMALITAGTLKAIRIGSNLRIPESELGSLLVTCAAVPPTNDEEAPTALDD